MPFAIELFFDDATEAAVQQVWSALAERRIAPYLRESSNRPHVSLAVSERLDVAGCARALDAFAIATPGFPVTLASLGLFPSAPEPVVFAAPVVTVGLLALHAEVCALLASVAQDPSAYYLPGRWTPHCSLAVHFPPERVIPAIEVCQRLPLPLDGRIVAIGAVETRPARPLFSYPLASDAAS